MPSKTQTKVRVVVVDDHALFREGLSRLLQGEPSLEVLPACASAEEALQAVEFSAADVVLLDDDLGGERGLRFLVQAGRRGFAARTLILTAGMSDSEALEALRWGAAGIFLKQNSFALLRKAIATVAAGEVWVDQHYVRLALSQGNGAEGHLYKLTERERQIVRGILEGLTNKEIAGQLAISESSVKGALHQVFAKTGARNRAQLVRVILERFRDYL
ncbi:MAG TPA: response regulator transcription factor [Bryobacteraceae bacterium]|nr:response regulator transcription factor [Bryobacteraceae bacterium]